MRLLPRWETTIVPLFVLTLGLSLLLPQYVSLVFRGRFTSSLSFIFREVNKEAAEKNTVWWLHNVKPRSDYTRPFLEIIWQLSRAWRRKSSVLNVAYETSVVSTCAPVHTAASLIKRTPHIRGHQAEALQVVVRGVLAGVSGEVIRTDWHFWKFVLRSLNEATIQAKSTYSSTCFLNTFREWDRPPIRKQKTRKENK